MLCKFHLVSKAHVPSHVHQHFFFCLKEEENEKLPKIKVKC